MPVNNIGLALGSNVGDRRANLTQAVAELQSVLALREVRVSPLYESAALLPEGAGEEWSLPFLNMVLTARMVQVIEPLEVLHRVKVLEQALGRQVRGHWGPREIDIDILFIDNVEIQTPELTLPHAAMAERAFVMVPLADIAPEWVHPQLHKTAQELAGGLSQEGLQRAD